MKKWIFALLFLVNDLSAQTVNQLTLLQAYELAEKNYPVIKQRGLVSETENLTIENLRKGYLPQPSVSGQATYQSDVTGIDVSLPGFNLQSPSKDQYKILGDVNQIVFDGGVIREEQKAIHLNAIVEREKVEVDLYKLKDRINQIYLGVLFLDEQIKQAEIMRDDV